MSRAISSSKFRSELKPKKDRFEESFNVPLTRVYRIIGSRALVDAAIEQEHLAPVFESPRLKMFSKERVAKFQARLESGELVIVPIDYRARKECGQAQ
jgi:hypothetical protein